MRRAVVAILAVVNDEDADEAENEEETIESAKNEGGQ